MSLVAISLACFNALYTSLDKTIVLEVEASQAGRNTIHSHLRIPASAGPLSIVYPKWIPGEHSPTGPINDVIGFRISTQRKDIKWQRDDIDMFKINLEVPAGVQSIDVDFDLATSPARIASPNFSRIKWNRLVFYPAGSTSDQVMVRANLISPKNWKLATALKQSRAEGSSVQFQPVSLTRLVDSPALIGKFYKKIQLRDGLEAVEIFSDNQKALDAKPETIQKFKNLVSEAHALFGVHHYDSYSFLLTLSGHGGDEGLEHHESSEDGTEENALSDETSGQYLGYLLSHEYTHSWNGKFRRPAGLNTPNFQEPMAGELLWVYEGMTEFIGTTLNPRSGLWSFDHYREALAELAALMEYTQGRTWRPLVDTARSVQLFNGANPAWSAARRSADYYYEMVLIWLEADMKIRSLTENKKCMDDFCKIFHGGEGTGPKVVPYSLSDVINTLNRVAPFDWKTFLTERVYDVQKHAPTKGIEASGWKVVYTDKPNDAAKQYEGPKGASFYYSAGFAIDDDGTVRDVLPDSASAKGKLSVGMKIAAVNGMKFTLDRLKSAIEDSNKPGAKLQLLTDIGDESLSTLSIPYRGGARYPHLERDASKPDLLTQLAAPHAKS